MDRTKAGKSIDSHAAHKNIQKSTTLNRRYVHRPSSFTKIKINAGDKATKAAEKKIAVNAETDEAKQALVAAQAAAKAAEEAARKAAEEQAKLAAAEAELSRLEAAAKAAEEKAKAAALDSLQNDTTALEKAQQQAQAKQAEQGQQGQQAQAKKIAVQADTPDLPPAPNPYQAAINRAHKIQVQGDEPTAAEIKEAAIQKSIAETNATYQPLTKKQLRKMTAQDRMHAEASMRAAQIAQKEMVAKDKKAAKAQAAAERQMAKSRKMIAKQTARSLKKADKKTTQTVALSQVAKKLDQGQHITKMQRSMRKASAGKRFLIAFSASAAVVAILGLIVRFNMPDVSVKVAAMQTGIEATYPTYIPRGYQLNAVTTDKENGITMEFGDSEKHTFTINEKKSSWDSNALLNNYVKERWGSNYTALREHGITIYVSDGNATWVNGGLVYNLASENGVLTKKQIKNIVTSL